MQLGIPHPALDALGLVTDGVLGIITGIDPPFVAPSLPVVSGGSLLPNRRDGAWLLDFQVGGQRYRFATRQVSLPSRDLQTTVVYGAGLMDLVTAVDIEAVSVSIGSSVDWAALRSRLGPISGRDFKLRYWYEGQYLEDAYLALQGSIASAGYADGDKTGVLALGLKRSELALSREIVTSDMCVDATTWPAASELIAGAGYPYVIGYPGSGVVQAVPALYVDDTDGQAVIAVGTIEATDVTIFDTSANVSGNVPVVYKQDGRGRTMALADIRTGGMTAAPDRSYFASFAPADGGGTLDDGRIVRGLGDLLIWGSKLFSSASFDLGRMEGAREALNVYRIDTVINVAGTQWEDWVQQNLIDMFSLEVVHGPGGIYYRHVSYETEARNVVAQLTTDVDHGGIRVARQGGVSETTEDVANHVTVQYAPAGMSASAMTKSVTLSAIHDALSDQVPHARCIQSQKIYKLRPKTIQCVNTADRSTAVRLARDCVARYALPHRVAGYVGSTELFRLRKGNTVRVYDTRSDAGIDGDLALVTGLGFGVADTAVVQLLFP